ASIEAQCAAIADDIAYDTHDIDDGLRSGLLTLHMLDEVSLSGSILREVKRRYPALDGMRTGQELMRRRITFMVEGVICDSQVRLQRLRPRSHDVERQASETIVALSAEVAASEKELKTFLYGHLYRQPEVMRIRADAERVVKDLY